MRVLLCDLRLYLYNIRRQVRSNSDVRSPDQRRVAWLGRRKLLRSLLTETPWWVNGHIELGVTEVELQLLTEGRRDLRDLGTLEVSAQAAQTLITSGHNGANDSRLLQVKYLNAMLAFFSGKFEAALEAYADVLAPGNATLVPARTAVVVLEHAGGAALLLGMKELAMRYFSAIPPSARSNETRAALEHLETAD